MLTEKAIKIIEVWRSRDIYSPKAIRSFLNPDGSAVFYCLVVIVSLSHRREGHRSYF